MRGEAKFQRPPTPPRFPEVTSYLPGGSAEGVRGASAWCLGVLLAGLVGLASGRAAVPPPTAAPAAAGLRLVLEPRLGGRPLALDELTGTNVAGQIFSVTRLDFLLSELAVCREGGTWWEPTNWFAYLSVRDRRLEAVLPPLPAGRYNRVRFRVGVPPRENHANPAALAADHPLNPNLNGLHWNWQGGYVFLALEGNWRRADGRTGGYSYHLATDALRMTVEQPLLLDTVSAATPSRLRCVVDVDRLLAGIDGRGVTFSDETSSTHSRDADPLARRLQAGVERAIRLEAMAAGTPPLAGPPSSATGAVAVPLLAPGATPYRFTFSAFYPQPALPRDNPLTVEGVELGRRLFHDPRLSINGRQSCATCHQAAAGFTDAGRATSDGAEGQPGERNTMSLLNLAWKQAFFWDGRAPTLREQVLQPIQNPLEMHETLDHVVHKLQAVPEYPALFRRAFGAADITSDRMARALEQFLLTLVAHESRLDRSLAGELELTDEEKRGFELFHTEYDPRRGQFGADCFHCHGGPLFQSQAFANNGLDAEPADPGRQGVTQRPGDRGKFAVPSLRNVALSAPYMHDGRFRTLEEVVTHYVRGVKRSPTLDPSLAKHPDGGVLLSGEDQRALVAFLRALTEEGGERNPKSEIRNPKEVGKSEVRRGTTGSAPPSAGQ